MGGVNGIGIGTADGGGDENNGRGDGSKTRNPGPRAGRLYYGPSLDELCPSLSNPLPRFLWADMRRRGSMRGWKSPDAVRSLSHGRDTTPLAFFLHLRPTNCDGWVSDDLRGTELRGGRGRVECATAG